LTHPSGRKKYRAKNAQLAQAVFPFAGFAHLLLQSGKTGAKEHFLGHNWNLQDHQNRKTAIVYRLSIKIY